MSSQRVRDDIICKCTVCGACFHPPRASVARGGKLHPGTGLFCSRKCSGVGRRGERVPLEERFWAAVDKNGPLPADPSLGKCWTWNGETDGTYGQILVHGKRSPQLAHRLSYTWAFGDIPPRMVVRHRCDRRCCVRPSHLCLGTPSQNAADWVERGAGIVSPPRRRTQQERFWAKVDRNGPLPASCPELGPCWVWTGAKTYTGCGKFAIRVDGKVTTAQAPRLSYTWEHGPLSDGVFACHHCDNPSCVRPSHLFPGDAGVNARDMVAKGRKNPFTRITDEQVREIRLRHTQGETQRAIARSLGIVQSHVSHIVRGLSRSSAT